LFNKKKEKKMICIATVVGKEEDGSNKLNYTYDTTDFPRVCIRDAIKGFKKLAEEDLNKREV